jgi:hypothetical protein
MEKKEFNPEEWQDDSNSHSSNPEFHQPSNNNKMAEVENIILEIESKQLDITSTYSDWINIGFAFADEFGEQGRDLFHRISRFYNDYNTNQCNLQYDKCLKANGHGISIATFFFLAQQAGIEIKSASSDNDEEKVLTLPTFPDAMFPDLPEFLQKVVKVASANEERDILLLGAMVCMSACFPKLYGIYDGKKVYSNLYLFITAQASAGKGRLVHCRQIVSPIHKELRDLAASMKKQYDEDLAEFNTKKGKEDGAKKPEKPPEKMLFIPANNSSTGAYQLLSDSDGRGLIFETEGDTLAHAFKSDYGNYSDGFRKAFHHETISYYRRTDREYVDINNPCLSAVLSGTPRQISSLIPDAENGLLSRFIFYYMNVHSIWKDVFSDNSDQGLDDYFDTLGSDFYKLYTILRSGKDIRFHLTKDQEAKFNQYFSDIQDKYITLQGLDYMAIIRRLGLIAFRFCMILSVLRIMETGEFIDKLICTDSDFNIALEMVKVLVIHAGKVFSELPAVNKTSGRKNKKEKFLDSLPKNFNRQEYLKVAKSLSINDKTAEGYITSFVKSGLIHRDMQDHYEKL